MSKRNKSLRKYPVTYKNKVYEARFTNEFITLYEVTEGLFRIKKYSYVDSFTMKCLDAHLEDMEVSMDSSTIHIERIKMFFKLLEIEQIKFEAYEKERKHRLVTEQIQRQVLENWDGIIE